MWWSVHLEGGPRRVNHAAAAVGDRIFSFGGYCKLTVHKLRFYSNDCFFDSNFTMDDNLVVKNILKTNQTQFNILITLT
jgi:hypothetical protein